MGKIIHERKNSQYDSNHWDRIRFSFNPNFPKVIGIIQGTGCIFCDLKIVGSPPVPYCKSVAYLEITSSTLFRMNIMPHSCNFHGFAWKCAYQAQKCFPYENQIVIFFISSCTCLSLIQVHDRFMLIAVSHPILGKILSQDIGRGVLFISLGPNPQISLVYRQTWLKGVKPQGEGHIICSVFF